MRRWAHAIQRQETQGEESDKFLSYFRPCIIPVQGSFSSHWRRFGDECDGTMMFRCEGEHVKFSRSSLDHKAAFIVDTPSKIFLFSGCNSFVQTRAMTLDVIKHLRETQHCGRCDIGIIEDGKLAGDSDAGEFWNLFGGYAPIPRDVPDAYNGEPMATSPKKLFCYILDCGAEIFLWIGMTTLVSERKTSATALEEYVHLQGRSSIGHTVIMTEGHEVADFKLHFQHWPKNGVRGCTRGMEKVAAIFKHQGHDVAEIPDDKPRQLISSNGCLKVWLVDRGCVTLFCTEEQEQLYNGDCYIIQYSYAEDGKYYQLFLAWFGQDSVQEDRVATVSCPPPLAKGKPPRKTFLVHELKYTPRYGKRNTSYDPTILTKPVMSSMNTTTNLSKYYINTLFIRFIKFAGALVSPNDMTVYSYKPYRVVKAVLGHNQYSLRTWPTNPCLGYATRVFSFSILSRKSFTSTHHFHLLGREGKEPSAATATFILNRAPDGHTAEQKLVAAKKS
ncbi:hypothetical protein ZWY2020_056268, partial [Hordeum vulgare]